jgi:hypothetical protein
MLIASDFLPRPQLRLLWNRLVRPDSVLLLPRSPVGTTAKRRQHFDSLKKSGKTIALSGSGADRAFLFTIVRVGHISPLIISGSGRDLPPNWRFRVIKLLILIL